MQFDTVIGRRQFSKALAISCALPASWAQAKDTALPVPTSLPQAALAAKALGQPLVLLISLPGCVYCELVRRSYLIPLLPDAGLQARVCKQGNQVTAAHQLAVDAARQANQQHQRLAFGLGCLGS